MPDGIQPVGAQIQAPNPMQGINTLSGILGLQQQRQNLQTGQYQQQTAQATATQDQQRSQELQKAQAIALNGAQSGKYLKADGSLDRQKMADDISLVAPTYGQGVSGQLLSAANEVVRNKQDLQNLNVSQRAQVGSVLGSLATDPNLDHGKVVDALGQLAQDNPAVARMTISLGASLPPNASPKELQAAMRRAALATSGVENASSQSAPNIGTVQAPGGVQPVNTNPQAPGGISTVGQPFAQAPHQTTNAAGQIVNVTPGGVVSGAPSAPPTAALGAPGLAPPGGANPTTAQATVQNTAAAGVAQRVQQAQSAANNTIQAQDALTRARTILDSAGAPNTGKGFETIKDLKNLLSGLGVDTQGASDANSLVKNLARYEASRATQAGLGGTDAARELAHNGSPNVAIDNTALKGIVTQSLATEKALATYANIQSKTRDGGALAKNESDFRSIPNLIEGYEYGLARNKTEADAFLTKHGVTAAQMKDTRKRIQEFENR